jgi:hypothetical protein
MKRKTMNLWATLPAIILLAGCNEGEPVPGTDDDGKTLTVTMYISTPYTVQSYADNAAMTAKDECDVVSVDVLVFATDDDDDNGVDVVTAFVYANVRETIDATVDGPSKWLAAGVTKDRVISDLAFNLPAAGKRSKNTFLCCATTATKCNDMTM